MSVSELCFFIITVCQHNFNYISRPINVSITVPLNWLIKQAMYVKSTVSVCHACSQVFFYNNASIQRKRGQECVAWAVGYFKVLPVTEPGHWQTNEAKWWWSFRRTRPPAGRREDVSNNWESVWAFLRKLYFCRNTISSRENLRSDLRWDRKCLKVMFWWSCDNYWSPNRGLMACSPVLEVHLWETYICAAAVPWQKQM